MSMSQRSPLVRVTVNLIPRAARALTLATEMTGDSRTDVINRAIQFYAYAEHVISQGGEMLVRENGEVSKIVLSYPPRASGLPDPA